MQTYKLMIKTHTETGMKYLCITKKTNYEKYTGSGVYWKRHLDKHGFSVKTDLLFESDDIELFTNECKKHSDLLDVANNPEFANLVPEYGYAGPIDYIASELGRSETRKKYFENLTYDQRLEYTQKFRAGRVLWEQNRTYEDFEKIKSKISNKLQKFWDNANDDFRGQFATKVSRGRHNMTPEAKKLRASRVSESMKTSQKHKDYRDRISASGINKGTNSNFAKVIVWAGVSYPKMKFMVFCKDHNITKSQINAMLNKVDGYSGDLNVPHWDKTTCTVCGKEGNAAPSFKRWHFNNCRKKEDNV